MSSRITLDGVKDYTNSIATIKGHLGNLRSEAKALDAQFANNATSTEYLGQKKKLLSEQIELQTQKVKSAQEYLDAYTEKYGNAHDIAIRHTNTVNNENAALARLQNALKQTEDSLEKAMEKESAFSQEAENSKTTLENLDKSLALYESQLSVLEKQYQKVGESTLGQKEKQEVLKNAFEASKEKVGELENQLEALSGVVDQDSQEFKELQIALNEAKVKMHEFENSIVQSHEKLVAWGEAFVSVGDKLTKYLTTAITGAGLAATKIGIDFETAFARVKKAYDNLTEDGFEDLKQGILSMDVPIDPAAIASVVEIGGKLGIAEDAVLSFTKTIVDMNVTSGMSLDEAASDMARFANITQLPQTELNRLGSTIVALGDTMATMESEVSKMGLNLAAAGNLAGMSAADIIAFAGTISSLGVEAAAGGTAASKLFRQINTAVMESGEALEDFAKIAGVSAQEFSSKFKNDAAGAINDFLKGLAEVSKAGGDLSATLGDLGINESRMIDVITRLAGSGDLLSNALVTANKAWEENTALAEKSGKMYETTATQMQALLSDIKAIAIDLAEVIIPVLKDVIAKAREFVQGFSDMDDSTKEFIVKAGLFTAAMGPLISTLGKAVGAFGTLQGALGVMGGTMAATSPAVATLAVTLGTAKTAVFAVGAALTSVAAPVAVIAGVIGIATIAWNKHKKAAEEARQAYLNMGDTLEELRGRLEDVTANTDNVEKLTLKWQELNDVIQSNNTDAESLARAKEELKVVEEQLIICSDGLISNYDIENGLIAEKIPLIQRINELEKESLMLDIQKATAGYTKESIEEDLAWYEQEREALQNRRAEQENHYIALIEIQKQFDNELKASEGTVLNYTEIQEKYSDALKDLGIEYENVYQVQADLNWHIEQTENAMEDTTEAIKANNTVLQGLIKTQYELGLWLDQINQSEVALAGSVRITTNEIETQNQKLSEHTNKLNENISEVNDNRAACESLESAYKTLADGQHLSYEELENLIDTYPELAEYILQNSDLTFNNGEIIRDLANTSRQAAIATAEDELSRTKTTIAETENRIKAMQAEIEVYQAMKSVAGQQYAESLGQSKEQLEAELEASKIAAAKAEAALASLQNTAIKSSGARSKAAKEENKAYKEALTNLEKRASLEKLTAKELIDGYNLILSEFAKTEDEKLAITEKITALQKEAVKDYGEAATEVVKSYYSEQKEMVLDNYNELKTAEKEQVIIVRENSKEKIELYSDEYIERIRQIDAVKAAQLESCNQQIQAEIDRIMLVDEELGRELQARQDLINLENEKLDKDKAAIEERQQLEKIARLEEKIRIAESLEDRLTAEKELADYKEELDIKIREKEIKRLEKEKKELQQEADEKVKEHLENISEIQTKQEDILNDWGEFESLADFLKVATDEVTEFYNNLIAKAPQLVAQMFNDGDTAILDKLLAEFNPDWQDSGKGFMDFLEDMQKGGTLSGAELVAPVVYDTQAMETNFALISEMLETNTTDTVLTVEYMSNELRYIFEELGDDARQFGRDIGTGLIYGMQDKEPELYAKAQAIADRIARTIASALQINSPSRVTRKLGRNTGEGLIFGLDDTQEAAARSAKKLANTVKTELSHVSDIHPGVSGTALQGGTNNTYHHVNGGNVYLNIEKFENKTQGDTLKLMEEAGSLVASKTLGKGKR